MKKSVLFTLLLCMITFMSCKNKTDESPLQQLISYYDNFAEKLNESKNSAEVDSLTQQAIDDFNKLVMANKDYFIHFLGRNKYGTAKETEEEVNKVQEAWKKCNVVLSEKTNGRYEYMPDFMDIYEILYEFLPKEPSQPTSAPYVFGSEHEETCDSTCEHEHEHND